MSPEHPAQWSYTRLQAFTRCPAAYKLRYIDGQHGTPNDAGAFGAAVHDALAEYGAYCYAQGVNSDTERMAAIAERYDDPDIAEVLTEFARTHLFDWFLQPDEGPPIERFFDVALPGGYGQLTGYIDLCEYSVPTDTLRITDYKTSWRVPEQPERAPLQLRTYAWAALACGIEPKSIVLRIDYVRRAEIQKWSVTPEDCAISWALALIDRISNEREFRARPGEHCQFCAFCGQCPALSAQYQPESYADAIPVIEQYLTQLNTAVKQHVAEYGPLYTADGAWDFYQSGDGGRRFTFPRGKAATHAKAAFRERVNELGLDWSRYVGSYDHEAMAELVPVADDPFQLESDEGGEPLDFSDILVPLESRKTFGFRRLSDGDD